MATTEKLPLDAPLERVPEQELEIIFLFALYFKSLGFTKIKKIQQKFPDCIAYRDIGSGIKETIIEFEFNSLNFYRHRHNPEKCDCIVCWEDNWLDKPKNLEVIELRKLKIADVTETSSPEDPLERIPQQELEIIFLFALFFKSLGFTKVKKIQHAFPDCIAYQEISSNIKETIIEFEFKSINFYQHGHPAEECDCIVCWEDNWLDKPKNLEVIELRKLFGIKPRIWAVAVGNDYKEELIGSDEHNWTIPSRSHAGDLILFYYNAPESSFSDIFVIKGQYTKDVSVHQTLKETDIFADIRRISSIRAPLTYKEIKTDKILSTSNMVKMRMQGRIDVTGEWHRIYELLVMKNPDLTEKLAEFAPEKIA